MKNLLKYLKEVFVLHYIPPWRLERLFLKVVSILFRSPHPEEDAQTWQTLLQPPSQFAATPATSLTVVLFPCVATQHSRICCFWTSFLKKIILLFVFRMSAFCFLLLAMRTSFRPKVRCPLFLPPPFVLFVVDWGWTSSAVALVEFFFLPSPSLFKGI